MGDSSPTGDDEKQPETQPLLSNNEVMLEDLHPVGPALNYDQVCVRHAGLAITTAPERWSATWEHNLRLARLADEVGIDFMLPVARDRTAAWIRTPSSARSPRVLSGVDYVRTWADGFSSTC